MLLSFAQQMSERLPESFSSDPERGAKRAGSGKQPRAERVGNSFPRKENDAKPLHLRDPTCSIFTSPIWNIIYFITQPVYFVKVAKHYTGATAKLDKARKLRAKTGPKIWPRSRADGGTVAVRKNSGRWQKSLAVRLLTNVNTRAPSHAIRMCYGRNTETHCWVC